MKALNLGCGPCYLKSDKIEWVNTDMVTTHNFVPDQRWDFREPIPLPDNSVDFILAWHILEHAGLNERLGMVKDWYRVLKVSGKLAVAVPDLLKRMEMYQDGVIGEDPWYQLMVSIYGPYNGFEGDRHCWGYNYAELDGLVREAGFSNTVQLGINNIPSEIVEYTMGDERKVVMADWAAQILAVKEVLNV